MKFEPGVQAAQADRAEIARAHGGEPDQLKNQAAPAAALLPDAETSLRCPAVPTREARSKDDSVYVKGESAISYDDLRQAREKKGKGMLIGSSLSCSSCSAEALVTTSPSCTGRIESACSCSL